MTASQGSLSDRARGRAYLALHRAIRSGLTDHYRAFLAQDRSRRYPPPGELLAETLENAVGTVPHYRGVVSREEIRADPFAALARFPLLRRETTRNSFEQLLSEAGDRDRWVENSSGGSTGEPVKLLQDQRHLAVTVAARQVYSNWIGGTLGGPELYIWGSPQDVASARSLRNRLGDRLLQRSLLDAFLLTDERIEAIVERLRRGRPHLVVAYVQAAEEVARFCLREGVEIPAQRALIATAANLDDPARERLEQTFGCRVFNRYGSREVGDMAGECALQDGLHVLPWTCHIEVLDPVGRPVGPGGEGEIAVTALANRAMPLIRYMIGDRARMPEDEAPCPCGRRTQMLAAVTGRTVDMFLGPDDQLVDGAYFSRLVYSRAWLKQFQVVQAAPDRVVYRIAVDREPPSADLAEIVAATRAALGAGCTVDFEPVEEIPPSPSGKRRYTVRDF